MMSIPASVYIICKNEELHIERALQSLQRFAEVIVLDSGSSDETLKIARKYTDQIHHRDWTGYAAQKAHGLSLCSNDWVLNIDADEELSEQLADEIAAFIQADQADALNTPVKDVFLGKAPASGVRINRKVRFYRKSKTHFPEKLVHESVIVDGTVENSKNAILHYGESSIKVKVDKNNLYSSLRAEEKAAKGKKPSVLKLVVVFPLALFKSYILRRSCLNGWRGLVNSMVNAFYAFLKEAKLFEAHHLTRKDGLDD